MGWAAHLIDHCGHDDRRWSYTHNTSRMIVTALTALGCANATAEPWYYRLGGCDGPTGAKFLHEIITELARHPAGYRAMNPSNGWGDYDSLLATLTEMRDAVPERPTTWETCG